MKVSDVMKLPSMMGAEIIAGRGGLNNPVESVTVLEYAADDELQQQLFKGSDFDGNELMITAFTSVRDDVEAQCANIRRFHSVGSVGLLLYYVGLILPEVDQKLIDLCDELDYVLICMPRMSTRQRYAEAISDILFAIYREHEQERFFVSTLLDRISSLSPQKRSVETLLRMMSEHLRASVILLGPKSEPEYIAAWPSLLTDSVSSQIGNWIRAMDGASELEVVLGDGVGHLQLCPSLLDVSDGLQLCLLRYGESFTSDILWQASECVRLFIHRWDKEFGKFAASELVRAIINDEPLQKNHLAKLFHIDVEKLDRMWLLIPRDGTAKRNEMLLKLCTERISTGGRPLLISYYEDVLVAFTGGSAPGQYDAEMAGVMEVNKDFLDRYELICCDNLSNTTDVHRAYHISVEYWKTARRIYPNASFLHQEDIVFAKMCSDLADSREDIELYLRILSCLHGASQELIPTMTVYLLDTSSNMAETARRLYVHLNTVKYRLRQIQELTGYSPTKMPGAYLLYIAAAINRLSD